MNCLYCILNAGMILESKPRILCDSSGLNKLECMLGAEALIQPSHNFFTSRDLCFE